MVGVVSELTPPCSDLERVETFDDVESLLIVLMGWQLLTRESLTRESILGEAVGVEVSGKAGSCRRGVEP